MSDSPHFPAQPPPLQQFIRDKCFHPSGAFEEFKSEETEQSIPDRFEKQVAKFPDRAAIHARTETLTFEAVNRTANRIAHAILARQGEGNEPVPSLFQAEASIFPTTLGVWKAGKIHVPIDPSLPRIRISRLLENLEARLVLINERSRPLAQELIGDKVSLLNIDEVDTGISAENPGLKISPETLGWIRFTSGSTGEPKGVTQSHRNILYYVKNFTNAFHVCPDDRLFHPHSRTTATPCHCALLTGASFYPLDVKMEGIDQLVQWLIDQHVTIYSSNPTIFRHFLESLKGTEKFPELRVINLDGESVSRTDAERYRKHFPDTCILVNRLGSGETGSVRFFFMDKQTEIAGDLVPVGYPVDDTEILILNDDRKEVGANTVGEIAVKGRYLSPGYWRNPGLTAAKFLADPENKEKRIYHTGDVGRLHPDGCLEHVGRKDFEVKIRGFKVEVGEVETALLSLPGIKEAAVVARDDGLGNLRLVAYIVASKGAAPNASKLRHFLEEKLPDYMIPSNFLALDAFPMTATGKLNRQALPLPPPTRPDLDTPFVSPRTPVEETLAEIWAEVLRLDRIGIHDAFFDLGGHSLKATQVVSRVIHTFQVEVPVELLFNSSTVADMALVITHNQAKKAGEDELARMLSEVEQFSEEEAHRLVADETPTRTNNKPQLP